ncbi:hypothetical protein JCM10003_2872 [Bacteroides pyogenes JCM 10003]|nr:hypothetical protein JCM10003_2872 [Bacteroides pyogenes JCM 10003]
MVYLHISLCLLASLSVALSLALGRNALAYGRLQILLPFCKLFFQIYFPQKYG